MASCQFQILISNINTILSLFPSCEPHHLCHHMVEVDDNIAQVWLVGWSAGQLRAPRDVSHTLGTARPVLPHCTLWQIIMMMMIETIMIIVSGAGLQVERHELWRSRSLHLRDAMRCSLKNLIVFSLWVAHKTPWDIKTTHTEIFFGNSFNVL